MQPVMDPDPTTTRPGLDDALLARMDAYWRAANYLSVGQIYLLDNPCCASRSARNTSSPGSWGTGARRRGST